MPSKTSRKSAKKSDKAQKAITKGDKKKRKGKRDPNIYDYDFSTKVTCVTAGK